MEEDGAYDAFAGVAFHCYIGKMANQDKWHNNFPDKELYFTECSGVPGSDFWSDIQVSDPLLSYFLLIFLSFFS